MFIENEGSRNIQNRRLLDLCNSRIREVFGKPDINVWNNTDFTLLSQVLFEHTKVHISANTLKRVFGRLETDVWYFPQQATRDALARYIGFEHWNAFAAAHEEPFVPAPKEMISPNRKWVHLAFALLILGVVLKLFLTFGKQQPEVKISCANSEGTVPHTALFKLSKETADEESLDGIQLVFSDKSKIQLVPNRNFYPHYYDTPGVHLNFLEKNGVVTDTFPILITTRGWVANLQEYSDPKRMRAIPIPDARGPLSVSAERIAAFGADTTDAYMLRYTNAAHTGISGDNFKLTCEVTSSDVKPLIKCGQLSLVLSGLHRRHVVVLQRPGCENWAFLEVSEKRFTGDKNDLGFMAADLSHGGKLELHVKNRRMICYLNKKQIFHCNYARPIGEIYAARIDVAGTGSVRSFHLADARTGRQFQGNF